MSNKKKHSAEQSEAEARKNVNMNTRGTNAAGQTNGQTSRTVNAVEGRSRERGKLQ